jgi:hypothetical protein
MPTAGRPSHRAPWIAGPALCLGGLLAASAAVAADAAATSAPATGIYSCTDDKGRKLTSDRPIPDCVAREQRLLNKDGSLRQVVPPTMTADERAEYEAAERQAALQRAANADAVRRDRNLVNRYPNEAAHQKARAAALDTVRLAIRSTELRVKELTQERKPLDDEAEFYKGRTLPMRLKQQLDANDAAVEAQRTAAQNQSAELVRINQLYDIELERLRRLWAGAQPGSLGPPPQLPQPAASAATAPRKPAPR